MFFKKKMTHTPTNSEFATFQILANKDFVNMDKQLKSFKSTSTKTSTSKEFVEPDDYLHVDIGGSIPLKEQPISPPVENNFVFDDASIARSESVKSVAKSYKSEQHYEQRRRPTGAKKEFTESEIMAEKEGLLAELHNLERQGLAKLVRPLTLNDSLEEIQFQYDRIQIEINANQVVEMAKSAIKMGSGMLEMGLKNAGIAVIDGYNANLCKDMNKFNRPLNRLYKKYWRRGGLTAEMELGIIVFGSLAWTVVQNKMGAETPTKEPVFTPPPPQEQPAAFKMKPPQMSSLHVPSSWAVPPKQEFKSDLKHEEDMKKMDQKRRELEERERQLKKKEDEINKLKSIYEGADSDVSSISDEPVLRKVQMSSPKSSKKKTSVINLDA